MLKRILDETSHGYYDFMYLRIGKFELHPPLYLKPKADPGTRLCK
jgi:hypothetical protein